MDRWLAVGVHWLHVCCAVYWLGSVLYTRLVLFPSLRQLPAGTNEAVRTSLVSGRNKKLTNVMAAGTIGLGFVRAWLAGGFSDPTSTYGITILAAAVLGVAMLVYLVGPWGGGRVRRMLYMASFPVIFTLMILMHFGL